ncbi:MAG TPA: M48 family metallopeptidase [Terriglobales bacterium]
MRLRAVGPCLVLAFFLFGALVPCKAQRLQPEQKAAPHHSPFDRFDIFHKIVHGRRHLFDIDAIGLRNVGCSRGVGNWYSLERQIQMGQQYSRRIEATSKLITDPEITDYINRLGQTLVRNSDAQVAFTIKVIDSDEVNAVALPGGFFYIDSGMILAADDEAELAGVMAHEIAHVAACHAARGKTRAELMSLASMSLTMVGGPIAYGAYQGLSVARPFTMLRFSRSFESEADFLGVQYMYKAGYDPQALPTFFERVKSMERGKPGAVARAFDSHPQTATRIEATQTEIDTLLPPKADFKLDTSEFQAMKARLYHLENPNGLKNNAGRPALRRMSGSDDVDSSGKNRQ